MKSRTDEAKQRYITYRNKLKTLLNKAERLFYHNKFTLLQGNIRNTWKLLNRIINKNKNGDVLDNFVKDGMNVTNSVDIVNNFNEFFTNIGCKLAAAVPSSNSHYSSFMNGSYPNSFSLYLTNADEILSIVSGLKSKTSAGYDCIPVNVMKHSIISFCQPLACNINSSFSCGKVPAKLKLAKISPIFKDGKRDLFTNYRPISVLPSFSKIFEKLVYLRLESYLKSRLILSDSQFGFRRNHSSYMAVLDLHNNVTRAIEKNEYVIGIFVDLSKAFDTIDHGILLNKLEHYGIRGVALSWFKSYLSNRQQFVYYNGVSSCILDVKCGVPRTTRIYLRTTAFFCYI